MSQTEEGNCNKRISRFEPAARASHLYDTARQWRSRRRQSAVGMPACGCREGSGGWGGTEGLICRSIAEPGSPSPASAIIIIGGSCRKYFFFFFFCRNKYFAATNTSTCLARQNTSFVATKVCLSLQNVLSRQKFCPVPTSLLLSRQTRVCRDKIHLLSRQTYACREKPAVATKMILVAAPANDTARVYLPSPKPQH